MVTLSFTTCLRFLFGLFEHSLSVSTPSVPNNYYVSFYTNCRSSLVPITNPIQKSPSKSFHALASFSIKDSPTIVVRLPFLVVRSVTPAQFIKFFHAVYHGVGLAQVDQRPIVLVRYFDCHEEEKEEDWLDAFAQISNVHSSNLLISRGA